MNYSTKNTLSKNKIGILCEKIEKTHSIFTRPSIVLNARYNTFFKAVHDDIFSTLTGG